MVRRIMTDQDQPIEVTPEAPTVQDPDKDYASGVPLDDIVHSDDDDNFNVDDALDRDTQDGKGDEEVPESDFESYAAGEDVTAYNQEDSL